MILTAHWKLELVPWMTLTEKDVKRMVEELVCLNNFMTASDGSSIND